MTDGCVLIGEQKHLFVEMKDMSAGPDAEGTPSLTTS